MNYLTKKIQSITAVGLTYLDEFGTEYFIDFQACYEYELARRTSSKALENVKLSNHLNDEGVERYIEKLKASRVVGGRNYAGEESSNMLPYIEFFTQPPIIFIFPTRDEFDYVIYILRKAKWRTQDFA